MTTRSSDFNYVESAPGINGYKATTDTYYKGSLVGMRPSTGLVALWDDTAGDLFLGIGTGNVVSTAAITDMERVDESGVILKRVAVTGASAVTDTGSLVWASDDDAEAALSLTATAYVGAVGRIVRWYSSTTCDVRLFTPEEYVSRIGYGSWTFSIPLSTIAAVTIQDFTPGFAGRLLKTYATATVVASTGSKTATLNWEIGSTNVTGGTIALTTTGLDVLGEVVAGAAITAANHFTATDTLSLEASTISAFGEGTADVVLTYATD